MTAPRHLWSGDWRRESAEAAEELARRKALTEEPPAPPPAPSQPAAPSLAARALAYVRGLRPQTAVVTVLVVLLAASLGYGAISLARSGDDGKPPSTWLGVQTVSVLSGNGVEVVNVVPDSPAQQAGLERGDVIIQVGNQQVHAPSDIQSGLAGMHAGEQVGIEYDRGPILHTTQATLRGEP